MTSDMRVAIETPRLILRDHVPEDAGALHAILSSPAATYYIPSMYHEALDETRRYVEATIRDIDASPRLRYNLAIVTRENRLIGEVGLHLIDGEPECGHYGLGYYLHPDFWNRGFTTEAAGAALGFIFKNGAFRVSASCLAENLGSRRVLEKCGMAQEALLRAHTRHDGEWKDCAVYRAFAEDRI